MRTWRKFMAIVAGTALAFCSPGAAKANETPNNTTISTALASVSDRLAGPTIENSDWDSIADNGAIDVRRDGTIRVRTDNAGEIVITLPHSTSQVEVSNGGATYRAANSATVTRLTTTGAQTLLMAVNESAPSDYKFQVTNGYVSSAPTGGMTLLDRDGKFVMPIPAPWAEDATGQTVRTKFYTKADRTGFTQRVEHRAGVTYPVVADPWMDYQAIRMWPGNQKVGDRFTVYFDRYETANMAGTGAAAATSLLSRAGVPTAWVGVLSPTAAGIARQAVYQSGRCATVQLDVYWGWLPYTSSWTRAC